MLPTSKIVPGRYRSHLGRTYSVLGVAKHDETKEEFVVYKGGMGTDLILLPKYAFYQIMNVAGRRVPRFTYLGPG